mmetsp:Transcript_46064/g.104066  ORF Transcript_46064/g.104066 Transcript_46064/m.104066 type:complete len:406 (+) Transcript_46064:182-1399(+)
MWIGLFFLTPARPPPRIFLGEAQLRRGPHFAEMMVAGAAAVDGPHTPNPGEVFRNPGLARCLEDLASGGKGAFYGGRAGREIVALVQSLGGVLTMEDLASHASSFPDPLAVPYHGVQVYEHPPNGQGIAALLALRQLEGMGAERLGHNSAEYLHLLLEAMRSAFADARWFVADPDASEVPVEALLSEGYAARRRANFDPARARADVARGSPLASCDTVSFQVVDSMGNAVSAVNSNYMGFGTGLVPKGCGFSLQNRGHGFSLCAGHPNALAGGKRPFHTIIPCMVLDSQGALYASLTNMGGFMQPQGHVQLLLNMVDFGMEPQRAIDAPRFCIGAHTLTSEISIEDGVPEEVLASLRAKGHNVKKLVRGHARAVFGRAQIIRRDPATGVLWGGSDGRADGCAIGW